MNCWNFVDDSQTLGVIQIYNLFLFKYDASVKVNTKLLDCSMGYMVRQPGNRTQIYRMICILGMIGLAYVATQPRVRLPLDPTCRCKV